MTVAALTDAGADRNYIEEELKRIKLEPFALEWNRVIKRGISSLKFDVIPDPGHPPKHHRHYSDIVQMIDQGGFQERITALSLAIFGKIAAAESKIHGIPVDKVNFHEVGAIDSIVDILGIALAIESLGVDKIMSSPIPLGSVRANKSARMDTISHTMMHMGMTMTMDITIRINELPSGKAVQSSELDCFIWAENRA
ncbi:MAG: hypothetical protein JWR03_1, partial [Cohnella sp.]|nr:hypothetical protein [Cohnella sp.]